MRKINELGRNPTNNGAYFSIDINPNNVFRLVTKMKIESTDLVSGRCMRGNDGTLYLNEQDKEKHWKAHMSKTMNEENERDQIADADTRRVGILEDWKGACANRGLCRNDSS